MIGRFLNKEKTKIRKKAQIEQASKTNAHKRESFVKSGEVGSNPKVRI
jgi:hypothetical protein